MSANKKVVENYIDGFNKSDHEKILSCLSDDVEWILPGVFHLKGKDAFDKEIENPAFEGKPVIIVKRATEENNVVITEGTVRAKKKDAEYINLVFCDVFEMKDGLIKRLTSYLMQIQQ
ncbi:MAG: nuclear transport factor 2 family protein [Ignavibacteriales bacterium]|nr:MAG: nuclear transport factor 2 family protein [Ignavibacteriales bacterium]